MTLTVERRGLRVGFDDHPLLFWWEGSGCLWREEYRYLRLYEELRRQITGPRAETGVER